MNNDYSGISFNFDYEAANRGITIDNILNDTNEPLIEPKTFTVKKNLDDYDLISLSITDYYINNFL